MSNIIDLLKSESVEASVPCRIDMGGTLDISTFYYPLMHLNPCTFNIAVNLRTKVYLHAFDKGKIKVSSRGFKSAVYPIEKAPFNHSLGLMFAVASFFRADGVHIVIDSSSPPRSALGGSSSAAVALIAAFSKLFEKTGKKALSKQHIALLAHAIEQSVAGVPCGLQDQLAAAFGGVNAWYWNDGADGAPFKKKIIIKKSFFADFKKNLLLAYCGIPHESKNINGIWVNQFVSGKHRNLWDDIVTCTSKFVDALSNHEFVDAALLMNKETAIRTKMTPDVLEDIGRRLVKSAQNNNCGARFTGAGGGGCIWAIGEASDIEKLKPKWEYVLSQRKGARLLDFEPDSEGLLIN
ncbi:MAG: galactokinase [Proteobacteria bacterium]|nr:galactokinase [Pseudomonadota bacterium]MBU4009447.1 galactokinase [Pseudomonadota bacterium]